MIRPDRLGIILMVVGIALAVASFAVDWLAIGAAYTSFGEYQFAGLSIGAMVFMLGYALFISTWKRH